MSETVIETRQLCKEFIRDEFHVVALKDVDLAIQRGEFDKTIVMVTHDPHAASFATRVYHLDKGVLQAEGQPALFAQKAAHSS